MQKVDEMDEYTLKRWSTLIDGVRLIESESKKLKVKAEFRQHLLVSYIDERTEKIRVI